jgi:PAS domain-containing protein
MRSNALTDFILILLVVIPTVVIGVWWLLRPTIRQAGPAQVAENLPTILFRNGVLEHASDEAFALFPIAIGGHSWKDLHDILVEQYPDFPSQMPQGTSLDTIVKGMQGSLRIVPRENGASLVFEGISDPEGVNPAHAELQLLRQIDTYLPYPAWKTDPSGSVVWHNEAYNLLRNRLPDGPSEMATPIFEVPDIPKATQTSRVKIRLGCDQLPEWFSVTCNPLPEGAIYHATSLTAVIKAEDAQRGFVQTLAKTFAHLSTGLAIFNRDRQLALFNPALIDLTGLSVSFLSPRPTIDSFFDAMRENRRMPEPKNYKTWRHRMADLISDAETGRFEETWSLETGQTFRVTGRPHPDGAIAFLIEDISAQISQTRNFRAELELGQSLADTFEDAVAVFSQTGVLTFSNKAYDLLWGFQGDSSFADVTINDAVQLWREKSAPNPMWQDLQESVMMIGDREEWTMPVCLKGQKPMQCKIVPIASGATVVRFSRQAVISAPPHLRPHRTID